MNLLVRCSCVLQAALCLCVSAVADNEWPQFRGPDGQGHASATGLPTTWSEKENIVWKSAVPGEGHSSPVISGDQIWLTTAITKDLTAEEEKERLAKIKGRALVISPAANWVYAYDPGNGSEIWKASYGQLGFSTVPRPVASEDTVYIATSYMQSRLIAVKTDGNGDVSETHVAWKADKQIPQKPSLLLHENRLYFVSDKGIVRCVNPTTGEDIWFDRLAGDYSASPLESEGHLYFCGQNGTCTVLQAGDEFKVLAKNVLDADFMASPAVAEKSIYLRSTTHLYRIENQ